METATDASRAGFIYTFYSYKGGTGRSMALANVASLLCRSGKRVLVLDWDLEAPGLEKYLAHIDAEVPARRAQTDGIVDLIADWVPVYEEWRSRYDEWQKIDQKRQDRRNQLRIAQQELARGTDSESDRLEALKIRCTEAEHGWRALDGEMAKVYEHGAPTPHFGDWRRTIISLLPFQGGGELHFISAGRANDTYAARVNGLRWDRLFSEHELGLYLEQLRKDWKSDYDFVLVDSRTGISDIEGICTVLLPDSLVLLVTTMYQSIEGVLDVWKHAVKQRARLPVPRPKLLALPLPSRDEVDREHHLAATWHERYAESFSDVFGQWLPDNVKPLDVVKQIALPYMAVWSFGERLPVVENATDLNNPRSVNAAYDRVARLLASRLSWAEASWSDALGGMPLPTAPSTAKHPAQEGTHSPSPPPLAKKRLVSSAVLAWSMFTIATAAALSGFASAASNRANAEVARQKAATVEDSLKEAKDAFADQKNENARCIGQLAECQAPSDELRKQLAQANDDFSDCEAKRRAADQRCTAQNKDQQRQCDGEKADLERQLLKCKGPK